MTEDTKIKKYVSKRVNKLWVALILTTYGLQATAQTAQLEVALRAPQLSPATFAGIIESRPGVLSWSEHLIEKGASPEDLGRLNSYLEKAQKAFLADSLDHARREFLKVTALAHAADWSTEARHAIHYAYLRLAQLSETEPKRVDFLKQAAIFASDAQPGPDLFPPPLVMQYRATLKDLHSKALSLNLAEHFPGFDVVRINGRVFRTRDAPVVHVLPGPQRLTLLSDAYEARTHILNSIQMQVLRVEPYALVTGDCVSPAAPFLSDVADGKSRVIYTLVYAKDCARTQVNGAWQLAWRDDDPLSPGGLNIKSTQGDQSSETTSKWPSAPPSSLSLTRRGWFWVGVSAALAASAYLIYRESKRNHGAGEVEVQPTFRQGL